MCHYSEEMLSYSSSNCCDTTSFWWYFTLNLSIASKPKIEQKKVVLTNIKARKSRNKKVSTISKSKRKKSEGINCYCKPKTFLYNKQQHIFKWLFKIFIYFPFIPSRCMAAGFSFPNSMKLTFAYFFPDTEGFFCFVAYKNPMLSMEVKYIF